MHVEPDTSSGDLRFLVHLSPRHYAEGLRDNRDVQIAALIAAFGRIPFLDQDDEARYPILTFIKAVLQDKGIPHWGEAAEDFDPAAAATAIEPFYLPPEGED